MVGLTSFDLRLNINPAAPATFGSGAQKCSPDVFSAPLQVDMNPTAPRKSLARLADFIVETRYSLQILAVDNAAEPKDCLAITVPNFHARQRRSFGLHEAGRIADGIDLDPSRATIVVDRLVGSGDRRRTAIQLIRLQLRPGDCPA